jgi:hypothetical protein
VTTTKRPYFILTLRRFIFRSQNICFFHLHLQLSWWRHDDVTSTSFKFNLKILLTTNFEPASAFEEASLIAHHLVAFIQHDPVQGGLVPSKKNNYPGHLVRSTHSSYIFFLWFAVPIWPDR